MKKLTTEQFVETSTKIHNNKFDYSKSEYQLSRLKVIITCPHHGDFSQRPNDHMRGDGCPKCHYHRLADMKRGSKEDFSSRASCVHEYQYDYSYVQYVNAITKVSIVCFEHGRFKQTPDKHLGGTGCPKCSNGVSRGEKKIMAVLDGGGIPYEREKRFAALCGATPNSRLRYDFYLPNHNLLIEYDGEHHFFPVRTKGRISESESVIKHERTKINDKKKTKYAKQHGYKMVRIPYTEFNNIESIISDLLSNQA